MKEIQEEENQPVFIYSTFPEIEEAERVSRSLVNENLAACANIFPGMISIYNWNDEIRKDGEVAVFFKTRKGLAVTLIGEIEKLHSYDVPAIVELPISNSSKPYCDWIIAMTAGRIVPPVAGGQ